MAFSDKSSKAVFLDRDGTINKDFGYVHLPTQLELLPNAAKGIAVMNAKGYEVFIISNQSGIARGYYTLEQAEIFNKELCVALAAAGAKIRDIFMCPHGDWDNCDCRKPKTGLFMRAVKKYDVDLSESYCFGDNVRDISEMVKFGCKCALIGKKAEGYMSFCDLYEAATKYIG